MKDRNINDVFRSLCNAHPELTRDSVPIGMGKRGIAIAQNDKVTKILFYPDKDEALDNIISQPQHETSILELLAEKNLNGIEIPQLLSPITFIEADPNFTAHYSMTRVPGTSLNIVPDEKHDQTLYKGRYTNSGMMIAQFHNAIKAIRIEKAPAVGKRDGSNIVYVPELDDKTNIRLDGAQHYLKTHMHSGNIHGDLNIGNILGHGEKATGLIDFSHTAYVPNTMVEFWTIPLQYRNNVIAGYNKIYGENIKPLIIATDLSLWTSILTDDTLPADHPHIALARKHLPGDLDEFEDALNPSSP